MRKEQTLIEQLTNGAKAIINIDLYMYLRFVIF